MTIKNQKFCGGVSNEYFKITNIIMDLDDYDNISRIHMNFFLKFCNMIKIRT